MSTNYSLTQTAKPYKSYVKRCLGKLYVTVLDPYPPNEPVGVLLVGNPRKPSPESVVDVWNEREDTFFNRANKKHFDAGNLGPYEYQKEVETDTDRVNRMTDEELHELLKQPFFKLKAEVDKFSVLTPLYALLDFAKEMEKSEKILNLIKAKISELEEEELPQQPNSGE